jgi:hypothetical protein
MHQIWIAGFISDALAVEVPQNLVEWSSSIRTMMSIKQRIRNAQDGQQGA